MPNWCQNQLTVTGATPQFRVWLMKHSFSFGKMSPPTKPRKPDPDGWAALESCDTAWGTKWDLDENDQIHVASELLDHGSAYFDTAWSPPRQALKALSRKFPDVSFQLHYFEMGMFFAGRATFHAGECHEDYHQDKATVMKIACDLFGQQDEEEEDDDAPTGSVGSA